MLTLAGMDVVQSQPLLSGERPWCEVDGRWSPDGVLEVEAVRFESPGHIDFFTPAPTRRVDLDGEWPTTPVQHPSPAEDRLRELLDDGTIVSRVVLSHRQGGEVMAIAAVDPTPIASELQAIYGDHLLLLRSGWTREEYELAHRRLGENLDTWHIHVLGDALDVRRRQPRIVVALHRVSRDIAAWHRSQPPGMVELRPWLRPMA